MGFIERLRQEKEAEVLLKQQQEEQLKQQREAAEQPRLQAEAMEKERHTQKRELAQSHFQESAVEALVTELAKVIQGKVVWTHTPDFTQIHPPSLSKNPDSVSFDIVWDVVKKGSNSRPAPASLYRERWDEFEGKFFEVETQPDGNIIFHARRDITIPESKWRVSKDDLESALEQAYYNPRTKRYNDNFETYHLPTPDSLKGLG